MEGSKAANVIPNEPYLVANLRPSVHQNSDESLRVLKKYADKYDLKIEVLTKRDASPVSNIRSVAYAYADKTILDHSASEISTADADILMSAIRAEFNDETFQFYTGTSYRHIMIWKKGKLVALVATTEDKLSKEELAEAMEQNRIALNAQMPAYSKVTKIEILEEGFQHTPKHSIKRFLYE